MSTNDLLRQMLESSTSTPRLTTPPTPPASYDPEREAAMNFVRQMRIYRR